MIRVTFRDAGPGSLVTRTSEFTGKGVSTEGGRVVLDGERIAYWIDEDCVFVTRDGQRWPWLDVETVS